MVELKHFFVHVVGSCIRAVSPDDLNTIWCPCYQRNTREAFDQVRIMYGRIKAKRSSNLYDLSQLGSFSCTFSISDCIFLLLVFAAFLCSSLSSLSMISCFALKSFPFAVSNCARRSSGVACRRFLLDSLFSEAVLRLAPSQAEDAVTAAAPTAYIIARPLLL